MQNVDNFSRGLKRKTNSNFIPRMIPIINAVRSEFFSRTINMYLQFRPFLRADMAQVIEILSHGRQEATHFT